MGMEGTIPGKEGTCQIRRWKLRLGAYATMLRMFKTKMKLTAQCQLCHRESEEEQHMLWVCQATEDDETGGAAVGGRARFGVGRMVDRVAKIYKHPVDGASVGSNRAESAATLCVVVLLAILLPVLPAVLALVETFSITFPSNSCHTQFALPKQTDKLPSRLAKFPLPPCPIPVTNSTPTATTSPFEFVPLALTWVSRVATFLAGATSPSTCTSQKKKKKKKKSTLR
eukprot:TRINITY_DN470_c0_g1_i1.p1 TRINITY_DN470_c0_g1~~TRINITY_DN470_c0_g1_i1.p1  ORF type:complete len:227 (+),score=65.26 TRINITY_DN470_c0_g1_i1:151-831(+)